MKIKIKPVGYVAVLAAGLPLVGNVAMADPIIPRSGSIVGEPGQYQYGDGGEFLATVNGSTSFTTFCIEVANEFAYGDNETYTLGQTTHDNPPGTSPLRMGTAYLFALFANNDLGYLTINSATKAGEFQQALWDFQGQGFHFSGSGFDESSNPYYKMAVSVLGANNVENYSIGNYGVKVIQAYDPQYGGQDWLYETPGSGTLVTPVPDGGFTVILLGAAMSGLGLLRRKRVA